MNATCRPHMGTDGTVSPEVFLKQDEFRKQQRKNYSNQIREHVASKETQDYLEAAVQSWPDSSWTFQLFSECAVICPLSEDEIAKNSHRTLLELTKKEIDTYGFNDPVLTDLLMLLYNYLYASGYEYGGGDWGLRQMPEDSE